MTNKIKIIIITPEVRGILKNDYYWGVAVYRDDRWHIYGKGHTLMAKCKSEESIESTVWSLPGQ